MNRRSTGLLAVMAVALLLGAGSVWAATYAAYTAQGGPSTVTLTPGPNPGTDQQGRLLMWGRPFYRFYNDASIDTTHYVYYAADQATDRNVVANGAHVVCYLGSGWLRWIPWPNMADSVEVVIDADITKRKAEFWYSGKLFGVRMGDDSDTTSAILEIW